MRPSRLYVVVPCYNEEEVLPETARRMKAKLADLAARGLVAEDSRVVFVNDGSRDHTWELITALRESDPVFGGINLSRNRGHQSAVLAGLMVAREQADVAISVDADLQDDIDAMDQMMVKYHEGVDIVYGVRSSRETDTFFKRTTAEGYYRLLAWLGVETIHNHADYRLMSRRALDGLAEFSEVNLYLRGIVPMIGFRTDTVEYERSERFAGESKYPLGKMLALAGQGVTSLSIKPIRMISHLGFLLFVASILMALYAVVRYFTHATEPGWPSIVVSLWAIGGLILLSIGVVGEYVGKIYLETKRRPLYLLEDVNIDGGSRGGAPAESRPAGNEHVAPGRSLTDRDAG